MSKLTTREIVAEFIIEYKAVNDLTGEEFGDLVDKDKQYIWKLENCEINVPADFIDKLVNSLNFSLHKLFHNR